jgi:hypothetical protein
MMHLVNNCVDACNAIRSVKFWYGIVPTKLAYVRTGETRRAFARKSNGKRKKRKELDDGVPLWVSQVNLDNCAACDAAKQDISTNFDREGGHRSRSASLCRLKKGLMTKEAYHKGSGLCAKPSRWEEVSESIIYRVDLL